MSEQELFNKFKKEFCKNCTKECTERSHGITIKNDYKNNLRCAACDEYKKRS